MTRGYAAAARRRAEAGAVPAGDRPRGRVALAIGLLLLGFLLAVAYRGTLRQAPDSERARQALVRDVEAGSALSDSLQRRAETLSGQLALERDAALTASRTGDRVSTELRRLETAAAQSAVRGPGIEVVAGDATAREQVDPATGERVTVPAEENGRLRDRDLQSLVNGLWAAGAEAVAVDGERLAPDDHHPGRRRGDPGRSPPGAEPVHHRRGGRPGDTAAALRGQRGGAAVPVVHRAVRHPVLGAEGRRPAAARGDRARAAVRGGGAVAERLGDGTGRVVGVAVRVVQSDRCRADARPLLWRWAVIAALALVVGVLLGLLVEPVVPLWLQPYLPIAVVAALDAVFGGIRARLDGIFDSKVFVVSFVSNVLVAALIVFLGDKLGVGGQLSTGVVVVLGIRIFGNAAAIRRHLLRA